MNFSLVHREIIVVQRFFTGLAFFQCFKGFVLKEFVQFFYKINEKMVQLEAIV